MWYSSNSKIVSVTQKGTITAKKVGTATITAVTSSGKIARCKVTVKPTLKLETYSATINKGKTYTIVATALPKKEIEYEVTDPTIATVDENGVIKGVGKGTTTIFVTCNNLTKVFTVTVK